jgi:hypothetical protein
MFFATSVTQITRMLACGFIIAILWKRAPGQHAVDQEWNRRSLCIRIEGWSGTNGSRATSFDKEPTKPKAFLLQQSCLTRILTILQEGNIVQRSQL